MKTKLSLLLLLVAFAMVPGQTHAAASLTVSPPVGSPGAIVTLSGGGYVANTLFSYCLSTSSSSASCVGSPGSFMSTTSAIIPNGTALMIPTTAGGVYYVITYSGPTVLAGTLFVLTVSLSVSPAVGSPVSSATLSGRGYVANVLFNYCLSTSASSVSCVGRPGGFTSTTSGTIPTGTSLTVPTTTGGSYYLIVYSVSTILANAPFTVATIFLVTSSSSGTPGTIVTLSGGGYVANTLFNYCLSTSASSVSCAGTPGNLISTASGAISAGTTLVVPTTIGGTYYIIVYSGSMILANAPFNVITIPLSLSVYSGPPGTIVTLSGKGYVPTSSYSYCLSTSPSSGSCVVGTVNTFTSSSSGAVGKFKEQPVSVTLVVPPVPVGIYYIITFTGSTLLPPAVQMLVGVVASVAFTVTSASLALSASSAVAGSTPVTLSGSGYSPGATYNYCLSTISFGVGCVLGTGTPPPTFTADAYGNIPPSITLVAPSVIISGTYFVIVYSGPPTVTTPTSSQQLTVQPSV